MSLPFNFLQQFLEIKTNKSNKSQLQHNDENSFSFSFSRSENRYKTFRYDPSTFGKMGDWYIERSDKDMIIISLKHLVVSKKALDTGQAYKFHITIYKQSWNGSNDCQFHMTIEEINVLSETSQKIVCDVICSTFYSMDLNRPRMIEMRDHDTRPSCLLKTELGKITRAHAQRFHMFISKLMTLVKK